jgi:hypothetical protein
VNFKTTSSAKLRDFCLNYSTPYLSCTGSSPHVENQISELRTMTGPQRLAGYADHPSVRLSLSLASCIAPSVHTPIHAEPVHSSWTLYLTPSNRSRARRGFQRTIPCLTQGYQTFTDGIVSKGIVGRLHYLNHLLNTHGIKKIEDYKCRRNITWTKLLCNGSDAPWSKLC